METKHLVILTVIILTSGCIEGLNTSEDEEGLPNRGLEIQEFSISDSDLRPEQQAAITARFTNYHRDISVEEVKIFNEGVHLDVEKQGCTPSIDNLEGAREGVFPELECRWTVTAPDESALEGFRERSEPVKLRVAYEASVSNQRPLEVDFQDITEIENTNTVSRSFSNGEVSVELVTESPITQGSGNSIEMHVSGAGNGRIDGSYRFEYTPEEVFDDCPENGNPISGSEWREVCTLSSESTGVQNLFFSTHYKYVKEPNLDITLVNRR